MHYVISDVHGHLADLCDVLHQSAVIDVDGRWVGGADILWFLGDFFDRGPDGVGVVELVMRLQREAQEVGGQVRAALGNHEILAMGMHRFGRTVLAARDGRERSFANSWLLNGGLFSDQSRLNRAHLDWMSGLPAMAREGRFLLMHSDTAEYLQWGATVEAVNHGIHATICSDDLEAWWECWRRLTTRYAFLVAEGPQVAKDMLATFGGERIVHGHSIIATLTGDLSQDVREPLLYADGAALAIDGGHYDGGPLLLVRLEDYEPAGR